MDFGTALVVVAGIGAMWSLKSQRLRTGGSPFHRGRRGQAGPAPDPSLPSPRETELEKEVESLRERIHVLERIATDGRKSRDLANEIESLRER